MAYTEVFAWGGDHFGQLGLGQKKTGKTYNSPKFCSYNITISKISCGEEHTCFISKPGHIYSMGNNAEGRLGLGDRQLSYTSSPCLVESLLPYKITDIACGWGHSLASTKEGICFSWGLGEFGALGSGSLDSEWFPVQVKLPRNLKVRQVGAGSRHSGVLADDIIKGQVYMWGTGDAGELATGSRIKELVPVKIDIEKIEEIALGIFHTLFLACSGKVWGAGGNSFGELGTGNKHGSTYPVGVRGLEGVCIEKIACGYHSAGISSKGELYIWGTGVFGEFLHPKRMEFKNKILDVSIGGCFGVVVDASKQAYTWGANSNGELGLGDFDSRCDPVVVGALRGRKIEGVSCGGCYCICLGMEITGKSVSPKPRKSPSSRKNLVEKKSSIERKKETSRKPSPQRRPRSELRSYDIQTEQKSPITRKTEKSIVSYESPYENLQSFRVEEELEQAIKRNNELERDIENFKRQGIRDSEIISKLEYDSQELKIANNSLKEHIYEMDHKAPDRSHKDLEEQLLFKTRESERKVNENYRLQEENEKLREELWNEQEVNRRKNIEADRKVHETYRLLEENEKLKQELLNEQEVNLKKYIEADRKVSENYRLVEEIDSLKQELFKEQEVNKKKTLEAARLTDDIHGRIGEIRKERDSLYNENNELTEEIKSLNFRIEALEHENRTELNKAVQNERESSILQELEISDLRRQLDEESHLSSNSKAILDNLKQEKDSIQYENSTLLEEVKRLKERISDQESMAEHEFQEKSHLLNELKENHALEISKLRQQIDSLHRNSRISTEELEHTRNLEAELSESHLRIQELSRAHEIVRADLHETIETLTATEKKLSDTKKENESTREELFRLRRSSEQSTIISLEENNYQIEKLQQELNSAHNENYRLREIIREYEDKYEKLALENKIVREDMTDVEFKNKELFSNLESELAQRAREYRERTLMILNTPNRRKRSPSNKPVSPNLSVQNLTPDKMNIYLGRPERYLRQSPRVTVEDLTPERRNRDTPPGYHEGYEGRSPLVSVQGLTPDRRVRDTPSGLLEVLNRHSPRYLASPSRNYSP